jgi:cation diffusion facilitator family transporter
LSDAAESIVNVVASSATFLLLRWSAQPEDDQHPFGHEKGEHIAAAFEGALLLVAAVGIVGTAVERWFSPVPLGSLDWGAFLVVLATLVNVATGLLLLRVGKQEHSDALQADGHHLLSDVWSSVGVLAGLGLVAVSGWAWLDPLVAVSVALLVGATGISILRGAARGLVDESLPRDELERIQQVLTECSAKEGASFHALRTRRSGRRRFISLHVLVPGEWTIARGHELCESLERRIEALFPITTAMTHLEPIDHQDSLNDQYLDRSS